MPGSSSVSRRTALKSIGSAAAGTTLLSAGATASSADMPVFVYPNTTFADWDAEEARDAIDGALTEIVGDTGISSKHVEVRYDHPSVGDSSRDDFYENFKDWVESTYGWEQGSHIGVSANVGGGLADGGNSNNDEDCAFIDQKDCIIGSDQPHGRFLNGAIQEILHTYIDKNLDGVQQYLSYNDQEEELGLVTQFGQVTPMATGYTGYGDPARTGQCRSDYSKTGYTQNLTLCTKEATEATYDYWV